jgi:6,7-dimethyl-8-ribityllumazine synthase
MTHREISGHLNAAGMTFAIVVSRFNNFFTGQLLKGALDCIERHGGQDGQVTVVWVPGANELPLAAARLVVGGKYQAVIALGAVIRGATAHADLINSQVSRSLARIAMDSGVPVINAVVCAENLEQAIERSGTKAGNKGWDGALAAIEMAALFKQLT